MTQDGRSFSKAALDRLIDVHGGDPDRWPMADRAAALALVGASPAAAARLEDARRLNRLLDTLPAAQPTPALAARILADAESVLASAPVSDPPPARPRRGGGWRRRLAGIAAVLWPDQPAWQPSAVFGLSLAAGLALGLVQPVGLTGLFDSANGTDGADVSGLVFGETVLEEGWP